MCRENAGLLTLTRVGTRRVVQISAGFMLFFSVLGMLICAALCRVSYRVLYLVKLKELHFAGKFGAVLASIPPPIFAALYCLFFAYVGMYGSEQ